MQCEIDCAGGGRRMADDDLEKLSSMQEMVPGFLAEHPDVQDAMARMRPDVRAKMDELLLKRPAASSFLFVAKHPDLADAIASMPQGVQDQLVEFMQLFGQPALA